VYVTDTYNPTIRKITPAGVLSTLAGLMGHWGSADGTGAEERLYLHSTGATIVLTDWSADGRYLTFWNGDTMFLLPLTGDRNPTELKREDFFGRGGRFSPDGRYLAFDSNDSGRFQIYVRPLDLSPAAAASTGTRSQVSQEGGIGGIVWRKDGKELFYLSQPPRQTVMEADVSTGSSFESRTPKPILEIPTPIGAPAQLSTVCSPDGERFVFAVNVPARAVR
jgi:Tol biopolymer transport system component